ncbi:tRNA uridine-5-carboxymethylaminomethyl(34) synthesis enzyme MnmG [Stakelama sp. CBK3Z-3]|uniref:tRNA uridine 5-carboxymethylaminomethyl modification enzyme MnmG n=1 Tax=Stakelama flava TaxID=2860338 RepID=A0ABS6XKI4_9SPHN|nr:tRNA uridine-5-carboxymethylaminomethyl(34) synthesis enzyme MnmG [Stakelama flava]
MTNSYDVLVVGGGHAGTEAAAAAARRGARTALITFDKAKIGAMSCNPAIGGLGKGHLVREVDAFDGLIARAADSAAIHYRMLNRSKGSAVWGPRIQADRALYAAAIQRMIAAEPNIDVIEGEASALLLGAQNHVRGIILADGSEILSPAVILATGTFLGGRIFRGEEREWGGRVGERAATRLGVQLREAGLPMARLKTGTPPRLDGRTIAWGMLPEQRSDNDPWKMSPRSAGRRNPQMFCAITRTNSLAHDIIRKALHRSPLFGGDIAGQGPRYCPSIEDKIHRFGDRDGHQVFLEPEGLNTPLVYPNGISTSLPTDVQEAMVRSMAGLEAVDIVTPGYAVEYDHIDPRALEASLDLPAIPGLYCAGQINGTTGYEEAAAQGLIAGLNAAASVLGLEPYIADRSNSYLGVMVDDLVTQGITEPYRMLTARAEFRLRLRANNAWSRLGPVASRLGCLSKASLKWLAERDSKKGAIEQLLEARVSAGHLRGKGAEVPIDVGAKTAREWLRFPAVDPMMLGLSDDDISSEAIEDARYAPYVERQQAEVTELRQNDSITLSASLDFAAIPGLSTEMIDRLRASRPATLGQASRVRGITPAALSAILLHSKKTAV